MRAGLELSYSRRLLAESQHPGIQRQRASALCSQVIHPRKEDDDKELQTASIFGSAKVSWLSGTQALRS